MSAKVLMLGLLIQLLLSWLLLRFIEHRNLEALGLLPTRRRLKDFALGLLLPIAYFSALFFTLSWAGKNAWRFNEAYTLNQLGEGAWYLFKSVAFETLIFEGALLYILIQRIGAAKAVLISGFAFGIYHWFSWNLFGQPAAMAIVFVTTGLAGWLWALAFRATGSIYLPFALHYGVDFAFSILFSKDKSLGTQMLVQQFEKDPYTPGIAISILLITCYYVGFPLLTWLYLRRREKQNLVLSTEYLDKGDVDRLTNTFE